MNKSPSPLCRALSATSLFAAALLPLAAGAVTSRWITDGNGNWSDPANWDNGSPTNAGDVAIITNVISAITTITINVPVSLGTLIIGTKTGFAYKLNAGGAITMDSGGAARAVIQQVGGLQNYGPTALILNSDLEINNTGGSYFNLTGTVMSGSRDIYVNANGATGTPYVGNYNTFCGNLTICSGKLMNTGGDPFGSVTNGLRMIAITNNASFRLNGNVNPLGTNRVFVIGPGGGTFDINSKLFTITGEGQLTGSQTLSLLNSSGPGGLVTLGAKNNDFTGPVVIGSSVGLKLTANGSLNHVPDLSLSTATCALIVTDKTSGYSIPSNQVVSGIGTITGSVNVANAAATLHPGVTSVRSPGVLTVASGNLSFADGGTYAWELKQLKDNAFPAGTATYSTINLTDGSATLDGGTLAIGFLNGIATPRSADAFWQTNHVWTLLTAPAPPTGTLKVKDGIYTDWAFTTQVNGNTLELVYGPYTAPQQGTLISVK